MATTYYARVCWNSSGWHHPTGEAPKLETNSYAAKDGFGHEEWLFNFGSLIGDYQYSFLQPLYRSWSTYAGKTIDITLWSIDPTGRRVYIGEINNCEVLDESDAQKALTHQRKVGWLRAMELDVKNVGGNKAKVAEDAQFNIRFRKDDANLFDTFRPIPNDHQLQRVKRYLISSGDYIKTPSKAGKAGQESAHKLFPIPKPYFNPGTPGGTVERHHAQLQKELLDLLRKLYGTKLVDFEVGGIDLRILGKRRTVLIELKTYEVAKHAIREALGQILEYGFFAPLTSSSTLELFIVAPAKPTQESMQYIDLLRKKFALPIRYCSFRKGDPLPPELIGLDIT
jgi:hypothetical protein